MVGKIVEYAIPRALYRYRTLDGKNTLERELGTIEKLQIWCGKYSNLNDPMEAKSRESALFKRSQKSSKIRFEVENSLERFGVASFTEILDHELMWAHYANEFRGICIKYNVRKLLFSLDDDCDLVRMTYSEQPPILLKNMQSPEHRAKMLLSSKNLRWATEREWRLITNQFGLAQFSDKSAISGVYLGPRMSAGDKILVIARLMNIGVPVYSITAEQYRLKAKRITSETMSEYEEELEEVGFS